MQFYFMLFAFTIFNKYANECTQVYMEDGVIFVNRLRRLNTQDKQDVQEYGWQEVFPNSNVWWIRL